MAGAMWDVEAQAVAQTARERGDLITVLTNEDVTQWRKATEPVTAAWLKQMKDRKIDGGKLIGNVHALLAKYANEPEPQTQPGPTQAEKPVQQHSPEPRRPQSRNRAPSAQPQSVTPQKPPAAEQKVVTQPQQLSEAARAGTKSRDPAAGTANSCRRESSPRSMRLPGTPVTKTAPAKELDIPL